MMGKREEVKERERLDRLKNGRTKRRGEAVDVKYKSEGEKKRKKGCEGWKEMQQEEE